MAERTEKTPYYEQVATKLIEQLEAGTASLAEALGAGLDPPAPQPGQRDPLQGL